MSVPKLIIKGNSQEVPSKNKGTTKETNGFRSEGPGILHIFVTVY